MERLGFRVYLNGRKQFLEITKINSESQKITISVPQLTILGPILCLIYINNLMELEIEGDVSFFADETILSYCAKSWIDGEDFITDMPKKFGDHTTVFYKIIQAFQWNSNIRLEGALCLHNSTSPTKNETFINRCGYVKY